MHATGRALNLPHHVCFYGTHFTSNTLGVYNEHVLVSYGRESIKV
jgi:hypothetical protein